ncbi:MAG: hypothetical protein CR997_11550 [Acidobacteria bacterium]|nr:MAG: hypothetical protein CR997_11550 [Acidobacteriota bacterium]
MKKIWIGLIVIYSGLTLAQEARVIPFVFDQDSNETLITEGVDFVEVAYYVKPSGETLFEEMAEKVWKVQEKNLLILGSTGEPLPSSVARRAQLYIQVFVDGYALWENPQIIHPQKDVIPVSENSGQVLESLKTSLSKTSSVDVTYLADLANYLAGNLSAIAMTATSYSIQGYGEVINMDGEWLGVPISGGNSVWTQNNNQVYLGNESVGIGDTDPGLDVKLGVVATSDGQKGIQVDNVTSASAIKVTSGNVAFDANSTNFGGTFHNNNVALFIHDPEQKGIIINNVGSPLLNIDDDKDNALEVRGCTGNGLFIGHSDSSAIEITEAGDIMNPRDHIPGEHGISIANAKTDGVAIGNAKRSGFSVGYANNGIDIYETNDNGLNLWNIGKDAILIGGPVRYGIQIVDSGKDGIKINDSVENAIHVDGGNIGVKVSHTREQGLFLSDTGGNAIHIENTNTAYHGLYVKSTTGGDAIHIKATDRNGMAVDSALKAGVYVRESAMGFQSDHCIFGLSVDNCRTAAKLSGDGGGLSWPTLVAEATNTTNGIAAHFFNNSGDSTMVLENDSTAASSHLIKGFRNGNAKFRVTGAGEVYAEGSFHSGGADLAETFEVIEDQQNYEPGDIMVISIEEEMKLDHSQKAYSTLIAGVYASKPGVILGPDLEGSERIPLGVIGVIPTKVNLEGGPIQPGDLLVSSSQPGVAMKADPARLIPGCLIGKALQFFDGEEDVALIEVLVNIK